MRANTQHLGFGIIGAGAIARVHAEAILATPGTRLAAVYDSVPERARDFAQRYGVDAESDLRCFLARKDVEVVCITTPSGVRADVAVPAAEAGKHLLCEKPLEVTTARADRIINACKASGVILACVFQTRMSPDVRRVKAALESGHFGRLVMLDAQVPWYRNQAYYDSAAWRGTWALDGGGALMNQSIHVIDLMLHFAGRPETAYAFVGTLTHKDIEVEDTAAACVRFCNGALGTITVSTSCAPGFPRRLELAGSRGSAVLESDRLVRWTFEDDSAGRVQGVAEAATDGSPHEDGARTHDAIPIQRHQLQIADLAESIVTGRPPAVPGAEGRRAVEFIGGLYASARSGKPHVFVSEDALSFQQGNNHAT